MLGLLALGAQLALPVSVGASDGPAPEQTTPPAEVTRRLPWSGDGVWLQGDPHCHYVTLRKIGVSAVRSASREGLDFLASTEHAEGGAE